jgi:hypothetical protein
MSLLHSFLNDKIIDCERIFENASTNENDVFLRGMLEHGGEINALLMNIGKRQAYIEVLDYLRGRKYE